VYSARCRPRIRRRDITRILGVRRIRHKNGEVDLAIFAAVSDMQFSA
jgi:hypothetical protein